MSSTILGPYPKGSSPYGLREQHEAQSTFELYAETRFRTCSKMIMQDMQTIKTPLDSDADWLESAIKHFDRHTYWVSLNGVALFNWRFLPGVSTKVSEFVDEVIKTICEGYLSASQLKEAKQKLQAWQKRPVKKTSYSNFSHIKYEPFVAKSVKPVPISGLVYDEPPYHR